MKTNYQSNSHKSKRNSVEDKKKVDKIVKGKVKTKKKNGILSSFINDDLQDIKKYIVEDVLMHHCVYGFTIGNYEVRGKMFKEFVNKIGE